MKSNNMASLLAFLEQMPTRALDEMLQAELCKESIDGDLVRLILGALEEREREYPVEINEEVTAAIEKFESDINYRTKAPAKESWAWVLNVASILLVAGLLFFVVPQAANAENFFDMLARWTDSVFEFFNPSEPNDQPAYVFETDHLGLQQIHEAVVALGVNDPVVPTWVPAGYEVMECKQVKTPQKSGIHARLEHSSNRIIITVDNYNTDIVHTYAKDEFPVVKVEISGIEHYVFSNNEMIVAAWTVDRMECSIIVDCQEEILYKILKSIYVMED